MVTRFWMRPQTTGEAVSEAARAEAQWTEAPSVPGRARIIDGVDQVVGAVNITEENVKL